MSTTGHQGRDAKSQRWCKTRHMDKITVYKAIAYLRFS